MKALTLTAMAMAMAAEIESNLQSKPPSGLGFARRTRIPGKPQPAGTKLLRRMRNSACTLRKVSLKF